MIAQGRSFDKSCYYVVPIKEENKLENYYQEWLMMEINIQEK